jgi:pectate lyase
VAKLVCSAVLTFVMAVTSQAQIPAFSGAEGFGAVAVGGRGGDVYHVTNLNNSGAGSLREALTASGPRTVVFDVSGTIWLTEDDVIYLQNPYITIAGQTAPGNGILIAGETIEMSGGVSDVICRYIRIRRSFDIVKWAGYIGCTAHCTPNPEGQCMVGMDATRNLIMDHMSVSWGTDENFSMYRRNINGKLVPTKNITVQWCINAEALDPANHAFACTWGGQGFNAHHNLLACNTGRNPSLSFSHFIDYRNNVIFNWRDRTMDGAGKEAHVNVINNYYKPGPATSYNWDWSQPLPELFVRIVKPEIRVWSNAAALGLNTKTRYAGPGVIGWWYVNGNIVEGFPEVTNDNWFGQSLVSGSYYRGVQWDSIVQPYPGVGPEIGESHPQWTGQTMVDHPEWAKVDQVITHAEWPEDPYDPEDGTGGQMFVMPDLPVIATQTAQEAYNTVLARAGAILPQWDAVDQRVIQMVASGQATNGPRGNGIIIHPDQAGGFPAMPEVHRPAGWDTDLDGMPDAWETARGLNPADPADRNGDYDNDGYTNLEEYLNDVGAFAAVQPIVWDGQLSNRYARIENWDIAFQPSRLDTAVINGASVNVDAIDQHAGILQLAGAAALNITSGWLDVATRLETAAGTTTVVSGSGKLIAADVTNNGTFRLTGYATLTVTGTFTNNGMLDISGWNGTLPANLVNLGTICAASAVSDLNKDCQVDFGDYARFAGAWAASNSQADLDENALVNWADVLEFASDWLNCGKEPSTRCWQ